MLADIVNNQVDFTTLQTLAPQLNSFNSNETVSTDRKSFDDMIQEVRQTKEKPVEKSEPSEKTETPVENKKVQDSDKAAETAKADEQPENIEKISENLSKETKSENKVDVKQKNQTVTAKNPKENDAKVEETTSKVSKEVEFSFNEIENLLENARKVSSKEEVKTALSFEDLKNLAESDENLIAASVQASEQILQEQNQVSFEDLPQLSENLFESTEEIGETKPKTFSFDKEGKITVKDFRSEKVEQETVEKTEKTALKVTDVKFDGKNNAEMTLEVASNVQQNITSSSDQTASAAGSNFQAMLSNQIQQNAGEIVKAGNIVLKDNDIGSIKLILKPEQLGNVKIDLHISDKSITGRIVVASQEAYNAFKESAESLKQAFINSGFESAGLDLAFAGQNNNGNQMSNQENPARSFAMSRSYGDLTETGSLDEFEVEENISNSMKNSVNIVA